MQKRYRLAGAFLAGAMVLSGIPAVTSPLNVISCAASDKTDEAASKKVGAPENIRAGADKTTVTLTWDKQAGADAYIVYTYDSKTKKYSRYKTVTGAMCSVKGLAANTKYFFKVASAVKTKDGYRPVSASKSVKAVTPAENLSKSDYIFKFPQFGLNGKLAAKQTGLKNMTYSEDPETGGGKYTATTNIGGRKCTVVLGINSNDRFYSGMILLPAGAYTPKKAYSLLKKLYGMHQAEIDYQDATMIAWVNDDRTDMLVSRPSTKHIIYVTADLGLSPDLGEDLDMSGVMTLLGQ